MLTEELPEHSLLGKEVNYPLCMMTEQLCSPASTSPLESRPMLCSRSASSQTPGPGVGNRSGKVRSRRNSTGLLQAPGCTVNHKADWLAATREVGPERWDAQGQLGDSTYSRAAEAPPPNRGLVLPELEFSREIEKQSRYRKEISCFLNTVHQFTF